jgi:polysaccharide deacetylase family protein (PEP-CTERM system associated)
MSVMLRSLPGPVNALTIDVEDWYQLAHRKLLGRSVPASQRVVVNTHLILDLLAEHGVRATFFVLGTVAKQFPELVRRINAEGHEVATHGFAHRRITHVGPQAFEADLRRSIHLLEEIIQEPIWGYRAPEFSLNGSSLWALEIIAAAGLRYDSSVFPIRHPRYGMPVASRHPYLIHTPAGALVEFPLATVRFLGQNLPTAGGGYLRVLPLAFIHWGIRALNREGQMAVMYVHPYEFEEEWLDLPVPTRSLHRWFGLRMRALKRNWGRGQPMQAKFKALLRSFSFAPLREVMVHGAEWQNSDILSTARPAIRPVVSTGSPPP